MILRVLVALCLMLSVSSAAPDPATQAKADALFDKGQANYEAGKFQAAIELFAQAYQLVHDPVYLFNIAQSYRKILDCVGASDYYNRYLTEAPQAENKAKVQQWLRELQPCVEQRQKEQEAARRGEQAERERREEQLRKPRQADILRPHDMVIDRGKPFRIAGIAVGSVGIIGLVVGITYGVKGGNLKSQVDTECSLPNTCQWDSERIQGLNADGERANTRAKLGYIGGGIAAVAGVGLYMFGRSRIERVSVTPVEGGATGVSALMVSARVRF